MKHIDAVYTWVNGSDSDYQKELKKYGKAADLNPERFRDDLHTLKYSLRSVEKYMPWVRHIYIITFRPQVPDWLNTKHSKISIVHHDEIFDEKKYQPTFNSDVIERFLHLIPGLSDEFIYISDDFLLTSNVYPEDFQKNGKIHVLVDDLDYLFRAPIRKFFPKLPYWMHYEPHIPFLIVKSIWEGLRKEYHPVGVLFRDKRDECLFFIYRRYLLAHGLAQVGSFRYWLFHKFFLKLKNGLFPLLEARLYFFLVSWLKPKFLTLNDDLRDCPDNRIISNTKHFLEKEYPEPSEFELQAKPK
ncbi:MAG: Stealth CR1 domain-containing protein [Candidatus Brocadiae bacterium]|nr:Stealth CR1 domain-containing protein [Candidatus Brocadiia bacterium]